MKQKPSPENQKPTCCASGSIVPNSAPRATPAITANITHAANAAKYYACRKHRKHSEHFPCLKQCIYRKHYERRQIHACRA